MRQFNVKFLLGLMGATVLVSGIGFLLHKAQSGRIARALLRQAERAETQGRPEQQVKYLGRYLEFVPEDNVVRADLGCILASPTMAVSLRARERALFVLDQVLLREPDRHDSRRLLAQMALRLGRFAQAREHLDILERELREDGEVARLLGQWHETRNDERGNDLAEAAAWYRKAIERAPHETESYTRLAYLLRRRLGKDKGGPPAAEADQVMNDLVARNPEAFQAYLARWQYRREFQAATSEEAAQDVARALELAPDEADVLRAAADVAQARHSLDEARAHLQRGLDLHPQNGSLYEALARVEAQADRRKEAIACLRRGIRAIDPGPTHN
jgi:tetratricopeptide (TPR) repeat protein